MRSWRHRIGLLLGVLLVLVTLPVFLIVHLNLAGPREHRFPFPPTAQLNEQVALELSKKALAREGLGADTLQPVLSGHTDATGREIYFAKNLSVPDRGWVLWSSGSPERVWDYMVNIEREGGEIVCQIGTPK